MACVTDEGQQKKRTMTEDSPMLTESFKKWMRDLKPKPVPQYQCVPRIITFLIFLSHDEQVSRS